MGQLKLIYEPLKGKSFSRSLEEDSDVLEEARKLVQDKAPELEPWELDHHVGLCRVEG